MNRKLNSLLLNKKISIETIHRFYCFILVEFNVFWIKSNPKDIMEFGSVFEKFKRKIELGLIDA